MTRIALLGPANSIHLQRWATALAQRGHPLTGGYPVIGAVAPYHLDRAGQIPVNDQVRFNPINHV